MQLPDIPLGAEMLVGGVSWSFVVMGIISTVTRFHPLTETQVQALKGFLSMLGYAVIVLVANVPEVQNIVYFAITMVSIFVMSSGFYIEGKKLIPQLKSNIKE